MGASDHDREVVITVVDKIHLNHVVQSEASEFFQWVFWRYGEGLKEVAIDYKMGDDVQSFPTRQVVNGKKMWVLDLYHHDTHHRIIAPSLLLDKSNYDVEVEARGETSWRKRTGLNRRFVLE